ncbi:MAG: hypothetical protein ACYDEH_06720 [Acidimicrobiales bacterium]
MPSPLTGVDSRGVRAIVTLARRTIVIAVKPNCDGCHDFLSGPPAAFDGLDVVLVSATPFVEDVVAAGRVLVAPEWMAQARIVAAPSYTVIDPSDGRVVTEGVAFAPSQVAGEIAPYLS